MNNWSELFPVKVMLTTLSDSGFLKTISLAVVALVTSPKLGEVSAWAQLIVLVLTAVYTVFKILEAIATAKDRKKLKFKLE